jgi:hypothetical protein
MGIDVFSIFGGTASASGGLIPVRDPGAVTGSAFCDINMNLEGAVREQNILNEFLHGNIPDFLHSFASVTVTNGSDSVTYLVMPDHLCIGSNEDYVRMPMNPHSAQSIADRYDCTLPTRKMVNDIWAHAVNKIAPSPWGPPYDGDMIKTHRIPTHNATIQNQLLSAGMNPQLLTSGQKKDVVITNYLKIGNPNKRVAIYGWIQLDGQAIQGLNYFSHEDTYEDYSHGIRMIANDVMVNGSPMRMQDVLKHPTLSALVSDEGPIVFQRY